jgi:hypothetical protein
MGKDHIQGVRSPIATAYAQMTLQDASAAKTWRSRDPHELAHRGDRGLAAARGRVPVFRAGDQGVSGVLRNVERAEASRSSMIHQG